MKHIVLILLLFLTSLPVAASDAKLYELLESSDFMGERFIAKRSPTGVDFVSKENIEGRAHPRFHIEIEGALPVSGATSLDDATRKVAALIAPEVDRNHPENNSVYPGLRLDVIDVNGVNVAMLQYKSTREPDTFCRRAIIFTNGNIYIATMSLHSVQENDRMGMHLVMLVIAMVNSNEIPGLRG